MQEQVAAHASKSPLGPVSKVLLQELREVTRRRGVVLWLDGANHFGGFVEALTGRPREEVGFVVRAFRGSYLELMLALDGVAGGTAKVPLLVHLPGLDEEAVKRTPIYELYASGTRFRKALPTLITEAAAGLVKPERIEAVAGAMTLGEADAWLERALQRDDDDGRELRSQLDALGVRGVMDDLLGGGFLTPRLVEPEVRAAIRERMETWLGVGPAWFDAIGHVGDFGKQAESAHEHAERLAFAVGSFALAVEYVDDLRRAPVQEVLGPLAAMPAPVKAKARELSVHLRKRHDAFYERTANATQVLLPDEVATAKADDLGDVDTFRFEEEVLLRAALGALANEDFERAAGWAELRLGSSARTKRAQQAEAKRRSSTYWLRKSPERRSAWQLVLDAARVGLAVNAAGALALEGRARTTGLTEAVAAYRARGAAVDQAHRHLEQSRSALLFPLLPEYEALRAELDHVRAVWRRFADAWATAFNRACEAEGFLPPPALQQRALFDDVVRPMTKDGLTAYFVVDGLRYEMGEELFRMLEGAVKATDVRLDARLAELPTVTEVGMNVLAPVANGGKLQPALSAEDRGKIGGFRAGELVVGTPETRRKAMHERVGGGTCPWLDLDEVVSRDVTWLRRSVAQAKLVVVHAIEIDKAGESGIGPSVYASSLGKLKAAWRLLHDAGVRRFVITADHGFLLHDGVTVEDGGTMAVQAQGRKIDPQRRHVFSSAATDHEGEVRVPLASLGYEGTAAHVRFPLTTAVFDRGERSKTNYVHGGNSLQERVIPVITVVHRAAAGGSTLRYAISGKRGAPLAGLQCLHAKVEVVAQRGLEFEGAAEIELALQSDTPEVQAELVDVRTPGRRTDAGTVLAPVGEELLLFFRLTTSQATSSPIDRAKVVLTHPSRMVDVEALPIAEYFDVLARVKPSAKDDEAAPAKPASVPPPSAPSDAWVTALPEAVRGVFVHLAQHGAITEEELRHKLGSARAVRHFALKFESYAPLLPFGTRIDFVGHLKRYVKVS
ncbi:MAG: BREX-6 system phosphatase PglZ [Sandaracinus sp.]|nr:BREX-6 system phosphatase PglZ [Sandaracinus sp.]